MAKNLRLLLHPREPMDPSSGANGDYKIPLKSQDFGGFLL